MKLTNMYYLLFLSAVVGYVYDLVWDGVASASRDLKSSSPMLRGPAARSLDSRLLAVVKSTWEECVTLHMHAINCKEFIDEEILYQFIGMDKFIVTKIVGKRSKEDDYYNSVVIQMDDNGMTVGRDSSGYVHYDFMWDGGGTAVTPEADAEIPPITAAETVQDAEALAPTPTAPVPSPTETATTASDATAPAASSEAVVPPPAPTEPVAPPPAPTEPVAPPPAPEEAPAASSEPVVPPPAPTEPVAPPPAPTEPVAPPPAPEEAPVDVSTYSSYVASPELDVFVLDEEVVTAGATLDEAIAGTSKPIAGGVLTNNEAADTPVGEAKLLLALSEPDEILPAGPRMLEPFDCRDLSAPHCCLLIKKKVRDLDVNHKAIQCFMDFAEGTSKKNKMKNLHKGKKVIIYANHNEMVSKPPKITGKWS